MGWHASDAGNGTSECLPHVARMIELALRKAIVDQQRQTLAADGAPSAVSMLRPAD